MPGWITDDPQAKSIDHLFAEAPKDIRMAQEFCGTTFCIYQPFSTSIHRTVLILD